MENCYSDKGEEGGEGETVRLKRGRGKQERVERTWLERGDEEVINEAAVITGACLRQRWTTTSTKTHKLHSHLSSMAV